MTMEEREPKKKMRVETENRYVHGGSLGNELLIKAFYESRFLVCS